MFLESECLFTQKKFACIPSVGMDITTIGSRGKAMKIEAMSEISERKRGL
jgi:hypothetical protein